MKIDKEKLRKIREEKGYSLRELAERSGVDYTSLYRWETVDIAQPFPKNVKKVAKALGVEIQDLIPVCEQLFLNDEKQEFDISNDILEWYKIIYAGENNLGRYFDLTTPNTDKKRVCFSFNKTECTQNDDIKDIEVSGDIIFNFSTKGAKGQSRYDILKKYIDEISDSDLKEKYTKRLEECQSHQYSKENCSLIPVQGNLQASKQGIGNDRADTFVWALDEYFENNVEILLNFATYENKPILKSYLNTIKRPGKHQSVYNYCRLFYNIMDTQLINEMIESGSKTIDSESRARKYIDLALRFWDQRKKYCP